MSRTNDIPPEAQALFKKYLNDAPAPADKVVARLKTYLSFVARVQEVNPQVNHELASRVANSLEQLLLAAAPEKYKYAQAAARYFIEDEDADEDLLSADGFADDIAVLNSVCQHLGREDLCL